MIRDERGFTLLELGIAVAIFALGACSTLSLFILNNTTADAAGLITTSMNLARQEIENNIWLSDYTTLNSYFRLPPAVPLNTSLVCYVTDRGNFKEVRVVVCYRQKSNNVIGEDDNLNGVLDPTEDLNGD